MLILKNTVKCKWTVRNKRMFFQDWGEKKKSPFLIPQLFLHFTQKSRGKKIMKILSRGSINKKTSYAYIKMYNQGLFCS